MLVGGGGSVLLKPLLTFIHKDLITKVKPSFAIDNSFVHVFEYNISVR